jgi:tetratricopeptide (TPR) repeat protein
VPAREVLADYLSDRGRYREALAEFRATLKLNPKRFNGLYGAGLAAERSGEMDLAERYYAELIAVASRETSRPEIAHARDFIESRLRRTSAGARRSNPVQKPPAIESSNMD